jgi:5-methylcytosine-specific restriction protein A
MPTQPSYILCSMLACNNNRAKLSALCIEHGGKDTYVSKRTDERAAFNGMYNTASWKRKRTLQLSKQPLCQSCLSKGMAKGANHVDHLFSWNSIGIDAFYRNIFQSLCHECHSEKTLLEREGIYRHYNQGSESHKDYKLSDYQFVIINQ